MGKLKQLAQLCVIYRHNPSGNFTIMNRRTAYLMRTMGIDRKQAWALAREQMDLLCVKVALTIKRRGVV